MGIIISIVELNVVGCCFLGQFIYTSKVIHTVGCAFQRIHPNFIKRLSLDWVSKGNRVESFFLYLVLLAVAFIIINWNPDIKRQNLDCRNEFIVKRDAFFWWRSSIHSNN